MWIHFELIQNHKLLSVHYGGAQMRLLGGVIKFIYTFRLFVWRKVCKYLHILMFCSHQMSNQLACDSIFNRQCKFVEQYACTIQQFGFYQIVLRASRVYSTNFHQLSTSMLNSATFGRRAMCNK